MAVKLKFWTLLNQYGTVGRAVLTTYGLLSLVAVSMPWFTDLHWLVKIYLGTGLAAVFICVGFCTLVAISLFGRNRTDKIKEQLTHFVEIMPNPNQANFTDEKWNAWVHGLVDFLRRCEMNSIADEMILFAKLNVTHSDYMECLSRMRSVSVDLT